MNDLAAAPALATLFRLWRAVESRDGLSLVTAPSRQDCHDISLAFLEEAVRRGFRVVVSGRPKGNLVALVTEQLVGAAPPSAPPTNVPLNNLTPIGAALRQAAAEGCGTVLLISQAEALPAEWLQDLARLLVFEDAGGKLLQVVLVGAPELHQVMRQPGARSLGVRHEIGFEPAPAPARTAAPALILPPPPPNQWVPRFHAGTIGFLAVGLAASAAIVYLAPTSEHLAHPSVTAAAAGTMSVAADPAAAPAEPPVAAAIPAIAAAPDPGTAMSFPEATAVPSIASAQAPPASSPAARALDAIPVPSATPPTAGEPREQAAGDPLAALPSVQPGPSPEQELAAIDLPHPATPSNQPAGAGLLLVAQKGDSIPRLYHRIYQGLTPPPLATVAAINPGPVSPGSVLIFPAPPGGWSGR